MARTRRDSLLMMATALGLGAVYWYGMDRPQQRKLAALREELELLRADVALGSARRADLHELGERIAAVETTLGEFERRIPSGAELGPFIAAVSDIANRHGLREQNLVPLAPEPRGSLMVLPIRMDFLAPFEATFAFLRDLEASERLVRVSELRVDRPEPFRGELKAELTLQVFYEAA